MISERQAQIVEREAKQASLIYFVYMLLDEDRPFYVGCSSRDNRLAEHVTNAGRPGKPTEYRRKDTIIKQMIHNGRELKWRKIAEGLTHNEALRLERKTILDLRRSGVSFANKVHSSELASLKDRIVGLKLKNDQLRSKLKERKEACLIYRALLRGMSQETDEHLSEFTRNIIERMLTN
jgi:hypothetical protein